MFNTLKVVFQIALVLCHFNSDKPIRLEVDTSEFAIAEILSQQDDSGDTGISATNNSSPKKRKIMKPGQSAETVKTATRLCDSLSTEQYWHPVAFWSRRMQPAKQNYFYFYLI